jgi:hypothetical protein
MIKFQGRVKITFLFIAEENHFFLDSIFVRILGYFCRILISCSFLIGTGSFYPSVFLLQCSSPSNLQESSSCTIAEIIIYLLFAWPSCGFKVNSLLFNIAIPVLINFWSLNKIVNLSQSLNLHKWKKKDRIYLRLSWSVFALIFYALFFNIFTFFFHDLKQL